MSINVSYVNNENNYSSRNLIHKKIMPRNYIYIKKSNGNQSFNSNRSRNKNNIYSKIPFRKISIDNKVNTKENTKKNKLYLEECKNFQKEIESSLSTTYSNTILKKDNSYNKIPLNIHNLQINMNLSEQNKFDKEEYREMFSKLIRDDYSNSIINSLLKEEEENTNFLFKHKINEKMRQRMADWMIEVLSNYHCDELTYFESVNIMDRYFKSCSIKNIILNPNDLHLIGVTCMFIASKYYDIYPLKLKMVFEKIAHKKLSCQDIKNKEDEIMNSLNFIIGKSTIWEFINCYIEEIFYVKCNDYQINNLILIDNYCNDLKYKNEYEIKFYKIFNKLYTKNMINLLKKICIYLAKMNCFDYNLIQKKPSLLAASTIFVAIKICEQINKEEYFNDYFVKKLCNVSSYNENDIIIYAQIILYNAKNFDTIFQDLENLKRIHFKAIIDIKETK